jgi:uncharacterized protein YvpB
MTSFFHFLFKTKKHTLIVGIVFIFFYTIFWFLLFQKETAVKMIPVLPGVPQNQQTLPKILPTSQQTNVLGATNVVTLPDKYQLTVTPRRQVFNLSCEFAAAATVLYHYTNDASFSPQNELTAEKTLLAKVPASQNPNIGVRMGADIPADQTTLYNNLNKRFGGADYYGVHAAPFIDVFASYGLLARPLNKNENIISQIQKAIFSGHVVMAWINVGYGESVDIALSYGTARVIKGEHAVVIYGYDKNGVFVMDPASGTMRYMQYETLLSASKLFALPFLEVFPSVIAGEYTPTEKIDSVTGLDRSKIKIIVENGSGELGAANGMGQILQEFGYTVLAIKQADNFTYENVTLQYKKGITDYVPLIKKDLELAFYNVASTSADLEETKKEDMVILVGQ